MKSVLLVYVIMASLTLRTIGAETVYFLVGTLFTPPDRPPDSYVLPLSQPQDIDYARFLISQWSLGPSTWTNAVNGVHRLVTANCVSGKDGINRNYSDTRFPEWSWHVTEFLGFADVTAEILDGSPSYTERLGSNAPPGEPFEIGYWTYTVVRELGPAPLMLSINAVGDNFEFYWSAPGTNYVYTLEGRNSLSDTNWVPIPGCISLSTNHCSVPRTATPGHFYRVRAEP
jgi:hypothetical protein